MNAIKNEYDGPRKLTKAIKNTSPIQLDFVYSQDPVEVDAGIRAAIRGVKLSIMAMGIALYRVDVSGLFIDLGFKKFGDYIDHLAEETGMARTSLYNWEYIGEAYVTHRADLDKIGFSDDDGPTKLPFLPRALENHSKSAVFRNIKDMSKREFEDWSKGGAIPKNDKKYKNVRIKGNQVFAGSSPIVSFSEGISPMDRRYYETMLLEGAEALQRNEYAKVYRFYDEAEAKRFDRIYQRELRTLRAKK